VGRGARLAPGGRHRAGRGRRGRAHGRPLRAARRRQARRSRARSSDRRRGRGAGRPARPRRRPRHGAGGRRGHGSGRGRAMSDARLLQAPRPRADLLLRDVRVLDPRAGLDARADVRICAGEVAELGTAGTLEPEPEAELLEGRGRLLVPAFFDPHVHLRTPGQEHKEDLESGTRAAAAGGFGAVAAMPNTAPVLDSAPLLGSLRETAQREARVAVGFLAAITVGLQGEQLTEMAELRAAGALGFTDDGLPLQSAGMLRKALQYQRLCGGVVALHEEDPSLARAGSMHEGEVSAALGLSGIPTVSESTMVLRDAALAGYEDARVHFQHLSCVGSVEAVADAKRRGWRVSAEVTPHHLLLTDENV